MSVAEVIINTALGYHEASAKAMILGLGRRKRRVEKDTYYIHVCCQPDCRREMLTEKLNRHQGHPISPINPSLASIMKVVFFQTKTTTSTRMSSSVMKPSFTPSGKQTSP